MKLVIAALIALSVAPLDDAAILIMSLTGLVSALVAARLRRFDIEAAPDEEARYVAHGRLWTNRWIAGIQTGLLAYLVLRLIPLTEPVALYLIPVVSAFALTVTMNDLRIRAGVRQLRNRSEEP